MNNVLRYVYVAVVAVLLFSFTVQNVQAQQPQVPCRDVFCPESQFPYQTMMIHVPLNVYGLCGSNCWAWVTVKRRKACGDICDVYIDRVDFDDPLQCSCGGTLNGMKEAVAADYKRHSTN